MVVSQTGRGHMSEGIIPGGVEEAWSSAAWICHRHHRNGECQLQRVSVLKTVITDGTYQGCTTRRHPGDSSRALH